MKRVIVLVVVIAVVGVGSWAGWKKFHKVSTSDASSPAKAPASNPASLLTLANGRYAPGIRMTVRTLASFPTTGPSIVSPDGNRVSGGGLFSPDGKHLAAVSAGNGRRVRHAVLDGVSGPEYFAVQALTFAPDNRLAYAAMRADDKCVLVVDGVEQTCVPDNFPPNNIFFSRDGKHIAYVAAGQMNSQNKYAINVDGKPWPEMYDWVASSALRFSPDGKRVAVVADGAVVENGVAQQKYGRIPHNTIVFSPDSSRMLYCGDKGDSQVLVENGKEIKTYNHILSDSITFSPDGKRLAYAAYIGNERTNSIDFDPSTGVMGRPLKGHCMVSIDGQETEGSGMDFVFSSDSKHLAYVNGEVSRIGGAAPEHLIYGGSPVFLDGAALGETKGEIQWLQFSPDDQHVAYLTFGSAGQDQTIVVDGIALPFPEEGYVTHLWYTSPDTLIAIVQYAEMGRDIRRVELKILPPEHAATPAGVLAPLPVVTFVASHAPKPIPSEAALSSQLAAAKALSEWAEKHAAPAPGQTGSGIGASETITAVAAGLSHNAKGAVKVQTERILPARVCLAAGDVETAMQIAELSYYDGSLDDAEGRRNMHYEMLIAAAQAIRDEKAEFEIQRRRIEIEREATRKSKDPLPDGAIISMFVEREIEAGQFACARALAALDPETSATAVNRINAVQTATTQPAIADDTEIPTGVEDLKSIKFHGDEELHNKLNALLESGKLDDLAELTAGIKDSQTRASAYIATALAYLHAREPLKTVEMQRLAMKSLVAANDQGVLGSSTIYIARQLQKVGFEQGSRTLVTEAALLIAAINNVNSQSNSSLLSDIASYQMEIGDVQGVCYWTQRINMPELAAIIREGLALKILERMTQRDPSVISPLQLD